MKKACFLALIPFLYYAFVQQPIVTLTELSISYVIFVLPKLYSLELINRTVTKAALIEVTHFREYLITEVERVWRKNFPIRRSISGVHRIYPRIAWTFQAWKTGFKAYTIADHLFLQSGITRVLFEAFSKKYLISMAMCEKNSWSTITPIKRKRILLTFCGTQNS